jgi:3D (Asp-Asp-Asp) domain-containing protein
MTPRLSDYLAALLTLALVACLVLGVVAKCAGEEGRWVWAEVKAYTEKDDRGHPYNDGFTAPPSSINLRRTDDPNEIYGIAAHPAYLPHGTRIYVPGYWEMLQANRITIPTRMIEVNDTMGDRGRRRQLELHGVAYVIEVRFRLRDTARQWGLNNGNGKRFMKVFIYK